MARATGIARSTIDRGLKDLQARDPARLEGSTLRRRTPGAHADRSHAVGRLARPARVDDAGRSDATAVVGVQEPCEARASATRHGPSGLREPDSPIARTPRLPPSGQSQEPGRRPSCRPERSIRAHQRASRSLSGRRPACDLGRHQEEGTRSAPTRTRAATIVRKAVPTRSTCTTSSTRNSAKRIPYGVYDIGANVGCVSVGIDHDTAQFAVNAIRRWRDTMGRERYPEERIA